MDDEKLSLTNIKGGAAVEMFDIALQKVMDNINDINSNGKPREINLKVKFTPSEDRTFVAITLSCDPKLMGQEAVETMALMKIDNRGNAYAVGQTPRQTDIPFNSNVTVMKGGEK